MTNRTRYLLTLLALLALLARPAVLACQDNALDLRVAEFNAKRDLTYQNFIYARSFAGGRFIAQVNYLRLAPAKYSEVAAGLGIRITTVGDASVYVIGGFGRATDANYAEPAILVQDTKGRLTGAAYIQRYQPLSDAGVGQWLLDMLEVQYNVHGPFNLGAALYAYQAEGGSWLTKVGPTLSVNDRLGSTGIRVTSVSQAGGHEIQLRRILVF